MFDFFRRLFGLRSKTSGTAAHAGKAAAPTPEVQQQFETLKQLAPLKTGAPAADKKTVARPANAPALGPDTAASFVCREPVLNRKEQIAGYIFDLQEGVQTRLQGRQNALLRAYDDALLRSLASLNIHSLLGHRLAFVNLSPASLDNPLIHKLPPENTVLMLKPGGRQPLDLASLQTKLKALQQKGFTYGWVLHKKQMAEHHPSLAQLAIQADFVQLQTSSFDGREINNLRKALSSRRNPQQKRLELLAQELHSFDEFNLCYESGFDYFVGSFVTSRENWHPPKSDINRVLALKLLNLLRTDEELKVIADQITADPVMTFKLLRYLNSPAIGLQTPILTIDKAILILGRERCYRWLSLLLFDIKQAGFKERLLTEQALTRAFFLESLAGVGLIPDHKDELFILGLFSMLDLLIGHPLEQLLKETPLPPAIESALLGQEGIYLHALNLVKSTEQQQAETSKKLATTCEVSALQILERSIEALSKAHTTLALSEA